MVKLDKMEYKPVDGFPGYVVSNYGDVVKEAGGRPLTKSPTKYGDLTVGLMKDGGQYRRSVKVLVARAFVDGETDVFDTPIQKDGNRGNLYFKNLAWRPRWHAIMYVKQFDKPHEDWHTLGPVMDLDSHHVYPNYWEAAIDTGSLAADILHADLNVTRAFPSGHRFMLMGYNIQ